MYYPPELWQALRHAVATADQESSRYALGCVQPRGTRGQVVATDGRQIFAERGFAFPTSDELLVPARPVLGCRELATGEPISVGTPCCATTRRTTTWARFAVLTVGQLVLDDTMPHLVLDAADEKNRQGNSLPLRADLAADLRRWLADKALGAQAARLTYTRCGIRSACT